MSTFPKSESQEELSRKLLQLYNYIVQQIKQGPTIFSCKDCKISQDNLTAYLALREQDTYELQETLTSEGFSLLNQFSSHILYTLEKIINHLGTTLSHPSPLLIPSPTYTKNLLKKRSKNSLGNSGIRETEVIITLDSKMIKQPEILEELLLSGVGIVRINCAHDSVAIWKQLIETLRNTETKLTLEGKYNNRCKIYMDLAGPKLRVGNFLKEKKPFKITVPRDSYGKVTHRVVGYIDSNAQHTMKVVDDKHLNSFIIAISTEEPLHHLNVNDTLSFKDTRNRKRTLKVIERINSTRIKVELDKSSFIDEGIVLKNEFVSFKIDSLLPRPIDIFVKKGDRLRIYIDSATPGHPASSDDPAGISATISKAFRNVHVNDRVFIDDGKISGQVRKIEKEYIEIIIQSPLSKSVKVKEEKGINMPDSLLSLNLPALTDKDYLDLEFITEHADIVGLSFVHSPNDLKKLRYELAKYSASHLAVVAKIETKDAIHNLARIILEGLNFNAFGVMIARGDLAVEVGFEHMPAVQEEIMNICAAAHVPVIWATGVLESLAKKGIPSRSEVTDASIGKSADAIMLNKGPYIIETVQLLNKILDEQQLLPRSQSPSREFTYQWGN